MIRYGGIYARHREIDSKLYRAIPKANIISTTALISGELLFCLLLGMIPWYALTASIGWNS